MRKNSKKSLNGRAILSDWSWREASDEEHRFKETYNYLLKPIKEVNMEKTAMLAAIVLLALEAWAIPAVNRSYGYKPDSDAKRISESIASEVKAKNAKERHSHSKAKGIDAKKLELPNDATYHGTKINLEGRIESLCGFEIGEIAKLPSHPTFDKDGNIIATGKLAKPFRKCTQYELMYSRNNHALYSIRIFSPAQKKMDDEAALSEIKEMAAAVKYKLGEKIASWRDNVPIKWRQAMLKTLTFQSLDVRAYKASLDKTNKLKGTTDARQENGWAFSITLVDRAIFEFKPQASEIVDEVPEGVDAL